MRGTGAERAESAGRHNHEDATGLALRTLEAGVASHRTPELLGTREGEETRFSPAASGKESSSAHTGISSPGRPMEDSWSAELKNNTSRCMRHHVLGVC